MNVLEFLSVSTEAHSVKELSERMKLPKSHICRLLKTLKDIGYVSQNDERKYYIGSINPLNYTAGGKICAAYTSSKDLDAYVKKYGLKKNEKSFSPMVFHLNKFKENFI